MTTKIGKLIASPMRLLAQAGGMLRVGDPVRLRSYVWRLSGEPGDAVRLLMVRHQRDGIEATRSEAGDMLEQCPDSEIAVAMGWIELAENRDASAAKKWITQAEERQCRRQELLLHLKLYLSDRLSEYDATEICERILNRNDLPGMVSLSALVNKSHILMEQGLWAQAEDIAEQILTVQEQPDARLVKWVTSRHQGQLGQAEKHFEKARKELSEPVFNILAAKGCLLMGQKQEAMEWLYKARRGGAGIDRNDSALGRLAHSDEFARYCREAE